MAEKKKASKLKAKFLKMDASKTYTFTLSLPGMISAVGAGVLALTFFFIMGILIGRGYRPEADVPQLNQIMPQKEHGVLAEEQPKPEILKAEELEFPDRLKTDPAAIMAQPEAIKPKTEPQTTTPKLQTPEVAQPKPETPAVQQPKPGEVAFDYTYQVASFRKADMAQSLADKLKAAGLRTDTQAGDVKGKTWYRVQVLHRGTPESVAALKSTLAGYGIQQPFLKKKAMVQ